MAAEAKAKAAFVLPKRYFTVIFQEYFAPIAQSVEQLPFKERVAGSIPAGRTQ